MKWIYQAALRCSCSFYFSGAKERNFPQIISWSLNRISLYRGTCIWRLKVGIFANFKGMLKNGVFYDLNYSTLLWIHVHPSFLHFTFFPAVWCRSFMSKKKSKGFISRTWLHRTKYAQNAYLNFIFKFCEHWFGGSLYHIQFITSI